MGRRDEPGRDERERAARRADWPIRRSTLREQASDDLSATTTPEERIGMMWPLAVEAWSIAGCKLPEGPIQELPSKLIRPGDHVGEGDEAREELERLEGPGTA